MNFFRAYIKVLYLLCLHSNRCDMSNGRVCMVTTHRLTSLEAVMVVSGNLGSPSAKQL